MGTPPPSVAVGAVIGGDFRIVRMLASGGMGAVFVAEQLSTGKQRALKVMHRELLVDERLRQRFEQEARVSARIESDHVVEVVGAGFDAASRTPWLAMELLDGADLAAYLEQRGPLGLDETRDLVGQLCHALGAAHRAGIVHRDLKPENVFVAHARQPGVRFKVKVLDFGIAKVVAEARAGTQVTSALGTPRYMAPEQTDPNGRIAPATDVWALGLIVFQVLTGRWYWTQAQSREGASVMQLMREVLFEPLVPASARAAQYGRGDKLPHGFDAWFARCVCREIDGRFGDAAQAWSVLDGLLARATGAPGPVPATVEAPMHRPAYQQHGGSAPPQAQTPACAATPPYAPTPHPGFVGASTSGGAHTFQPAARASASRSGAIVAVLVLAMLGVGVVVIVGGVLLLRPRALAGLFANRDLAGSWEIAAAQNVDGTRYVGGVLIAESGEAYRLQWNLGKGGGYEGVGIAEGDILGVGWAQQAGRYGVTAYQIDGGRLLGRTVSADAPSSISTEELSGPVGLSGTYQIVKSSVGNRGSVTITPNGPNYAVRWVIGSAVLRGVGLRERDVFVVGWSQGMPVGVVTYAIQKRRLVGKWALLDDGRVGTETLQRK